MRVAITTSADRFGEVAEHFAGFGLEPISTPCIRVVPSTDHRVREMREAAEGSDLLLLTSRRPLEILWPGESMPDVPVAAVGPTTAAGVSDRGGRVVVVGSGGAAELLARVDVDGKVVVYPHAEGASREMLRSLERRAARLAAAAVYRTEPIPPPRDPVRGAAFGSPSAVEGWTMARPLDGLVVGVIGRTTASAVEAVGRIVDVMPDRPGYPALARVLAAHMRDIEEEL